MSWSINAIGKPENIVKALEAESTKMTGQSKVEYDDALPHLVGLVKQNFLGPDSEPPLIEVNANGSGYAKDGQQVTRDCAVTIKRHYTRMV